MVHRMECTVAWNNVAGLMNISHKLCVPALQKECRTFLLTHAAGKPIKAMRIAELYQEEELYRESSRFVLDNPGGWTDQELNTLSQETLLKLEKRYVCCLPYDLALIAQNLSPKKQTELVSRTGLEIRSNHDLEGVPMCEFLDDEDSVLSLSSCFLVSYLS